jgi:histidyl-tRNA synthetase
VNPNQQHVLRPLLRSTLLVASNPSLTLARRHASTSAPEAPLFSSTVLQTYSSTMGKKDKDDKLAKLGFVLKTPKGTKDWSGADVLLRDKIFTTISTVFRAHGAVALDTPVFELRDVLAGKYGEDSKLIYDLQDQGGELCSLRYDLTVPFARWLAMNPDVKSIKRYAIAKVYRRDQPAMSKGRMREFYQCDFDFAGATGDVMVSDSEVIRIIVEVFEALGWNGKYIIKVNHRKVLDGVFEVCGVPAEKTRTISSAVDKLDKMPWLEVRREMVEEKGLDPEVADRIETYVTLKGGQKLLNRLREDDKLLRSERAKQGIEEMRLLMQYLEAFGVLDKISFDMSLARGLDYYTGVIYEVVTEGSAPVIANGDAQEVPQKSKKKKAADDDDRSDDPTIGVGSVAAGGRYDHLVDRFLPGAEMPCVGVSFGVDRIFSITKAQMEREKKLNELRGSETDVYVMALGGSGFDGMLTQRMAICKLLWDAGIKAEFHYKKKSKFQQQFTAAEKIGCALTVQLGEDEQENGQVRLKQLGLPKDHPEKEGVLVQIDVLAEEVKRKLASMAKTGAVAEIVGDTAKMSV